MNLNDFSYKMTSSALPPSFELDPKEVLAHLNYLGYHHITGQQLKDFIRDLKKLIRYDQVTMKEDISASKKERPVIHSTKLRSDRVTMKENVSTLNHEGLVTLSPQKRKSSQPSVSHLEKPKKTTDKKTASTLTRAAGASSSSLTSDATIPSLLNPPTSPKQRPLRSIQPKSCTKSSSTSAFIRSWQMRPNQQVHKAGTTSDPVALYQYYKELWKLQPLPGEDNRTELRWKIREKMLGCNPTPRLNEEMQTRSPPKRNKKRFKNHPSFYLFNGKVTEEKNVNEKLNKKDNSNMENESKLPLTRSPKQNVAKENKTCQNWGEFKKRIRRKKDFESREKSMPAKIMDVNVKNLTAQCKCLKNEDRLGFYRVKIPVDTSLNEVVRNYAIPLAKKLQHDNVYISTKIHCK